MSYVSEHFSVLSGIAKCIAKQFGVNCEVVLHDLTLPYDHTIVYIENGHITGRKLGDSGTNIGLEVLRGTKSEGNNPDRYNYVNHTKTGKILRSSSKYIEDEQGNIVGSLCINFDITDLVTAGKNINYLAFLDGGDDTKEIFTGNVDELLDILELDAINHVGKQVADMNKDDKVSVVRYLDEKGAFLIKKSVDAVSGFLGISKFTLYNYLDRKDPDADEEQKIPQM